MENYKIKVNNEVESKEIQELFFELGFGWCCGDVKKTRNTSDSYIYCHKISKDMTFWNIDESFYNHKNKEITLQQLRDLVVLKRNDINDATHICGTSKVLKLETKDYKIWDAPYNVWVDYIGSQTDFRRGLKPIEKEVKMKEYLELQKDGSYELVLAYRKEGNSWIEVPEGAEIFLLDKFCGVEALYFVKHDGEVFHEYYINITGLQNNTWIKGTIKELHKRMGEVLWQRNPETPNTSIQEKLKSIKKNGEVKMKEFLNPEQGYSLVECFVGETPIPKGWIEIPEGAEEYRDNHRFYKNNGKLFYATYGEWGEWVESGLTNFETLWQRNPETPNTSIQDKLKFIEKWLNGEKIQYILGDISEKTQVDESKWHNFTEGAMQYIKRSDINFREAPKYVTIDGIEFKNIESILNYIKSNFDLEDGE